MIISINGKKHLEMEMEKNSKLIYYKTQQTKNKKKRLI